MGYVNARDVARLGPILLPHVAELGGDPALSPARSPFPAGAGLSPPRHRRQRRPRDRVDAARRATLAARGVAAHVLLTPLITHAEVDGVDGRAIWRLIHFWSEMLE